MSTYMVKPADIQRQWYVLDAAGKPLGRTAATAAALLHGKHKPVFTPNEDCGDFVVIINIEKAVLTGRKLVQKMYRTHSGYVGHLKETKYATIMEQKPDLAMMLAVRGMLPHNHIGREQLTRLKLFVGPEHKHAAQKPVEWTGNL